MTEALFGPLIDGDTVEQAVIAHLKRWLPRYLQEVEVRKGMVAGTLQQPRSWNLVAEDESSKWPEHQLPAAMVICPGTNDRPVKQGDGTVSVPYQVAIAIVVSGKDEHATRKLAHIYGATAAWVLLQRPGFKGTALEGKVAGTEWLDDEPLADESRRTLWSMRQVFALTVNDVMNAQLGPAESAPPIDESSPYTASTVLVETADRA